MLWWVADYLDETEADIATPPVSTSAPTAIAPAVPRGYPETLEDDLVTQILRRAKERTLNKRVARTIARECIRLAAAAQLAPVSGEHPCKARPMYVPGSSAPVTTAHDANTIANTPAWIKLNYVSRDHRKNLLSTKWYDLTSHQPNTCSSRPSVVPCQYPYFASAQSGPGASLAPMEDKVDHAASAGFYSAFLGKCDLQSGGPTASPTNLIGDPFLVVPPNFAGAPPTIWWLC